MVASFSALLVVSSSAFGWSNFGPFDASVAKPERILGYEAGDKHTTFRDQERVIQSIASSSKAKVRVIEFGKSTEGRPLRLVAISSAQNIARLEQIREDIGKLNHPTGQINVDPLIKKTPAIVWINECIHGNESASFESAMWLIYVLAASKSAEINAMLGNTVVLVNPVYNPDGHERFVVWYNSIANGSYEPGAYEQREPAVIYGRLNHYRFDMNRDRVAMSQAETRQEVAEFLRWNPQVYVDQHGQVDNYFFPPNPMAVNANVDRTRINKWTEIIGKENARAFDKMGWSYYVKESFDLFYAGYLDSWTSLSGSIGMTYETEGGSRINYLRDDGTLATLREGIQKHFVAAISTIKASADNKDSLLNSFVNFKKNVLNGNLLGEFRRVVVVNSDKRPLMRLAAQLRLNGIQCGFSKAEFVMKNANSYWDSDIKDQTIPKGSLVIDLAQPQGMVAKSLLEPQPNFEDEFVKQEMDRFKKMQGEEKYPSAGFPEFYDAAGWCLIYGHNLKAFWSSDSSPLEIQPQLNLVLGKVEDGQVGWYLKIHDWDEMLAALDLASMGVRCRYSPETMKVGSESLPPGTVYIFKARNEENVRTQIETVSANRNVTFNALNTSYPDSGREGPGSESTRAISKSKIGIVFGSSDNLSDMSAIWYLMEKEFELPFVSLSANAMRGDLSKYSCIIVPSGSSVSSNDKLKEWVRNGGCLILLGSPEWAIGEGNFVSLNRNEPEKGKEFMFVPTSLYRAKVDNRLFLGYGIESGQFAVPFSGNSGYLAKKSGGGVVQFESDKKINFLLSGWTYGENTNEILAGTVWAHNEPFGRGHVVLFFQDPTERAMWPGLYRLVLNAILYGPSQ